MSAVLGAAFGAALFLHVSLTLWRGLAQAERAAKPLTTQFIKRQPRLTKPLDLKRRPQPKRRLVQRRMVAVQARTQQRDKLASWEPMQILGRLAKPHVRAQRPSALASSRMEPASLSGIVQSTKDVEHRIDMSLELLDINALNTGRYHAMVVQDPNDKRNVRGYFCFRYVRSVTMDLSTNDGYVRWFKGLRKLMAFMNQNTPIRVEIGPLVEFDSRELLETPWVYTMSSKPYQLTKGEVLNLGRYLVAGGFVFADANHLETTRRLNGVDMCNRVSFRDALGTQGIEENREYYVDFLPNGHPVYHCYYDFASGPPKGYRDYYLSRDPGRYAGPSEGYPFLEGLFLGQRVAAILCNKFYCKNWESGFDNPMHDNTRVYQLGVNTIIFALTQEGSITRRLMDSVK